MAWEYREPEKRNTTRDGEHLRAVAVHAQAQAFEEGLDRLAPVPERGLLIREQQEIVAVAQIRGATKLALHELVQRMQVRVGEKLAGLVADGQPPRAQHRRQVVAREPLHAVDVVVHTHAACEDALKQAEYACVVHQPADLRERN